MAPISKISVVSGKAFSMITNFLSKMPAGNQLGVTAEGPYTVHSLLSLLENSDHVQHIESVVDGDLLTVQTVAAAVTSALGNTQAPVPPVETPVVDPTNPAAA